jgi:epoxyqueuosine reductase QueG
MSKEKVEPVPFDAIREYAQSLGADLVGYAPVSEWGPEIDVPPELYPEAIWPKARSVIVLALRKQNGEGSAEIRILDEAAYRLAVWLCERKYASVHLPADTGEQTYIANAAIPLFSHEWAGQAASLGLVDKSGALIESGGELRAVSVLTALEPNR